MKFTDICDEIIGENEDNLVIEKYEIDGTDKVGNDTLLKAALDASREASIAYKAEKKRIDKELKDAQATMKAATKAYDQAKWEHSKAKTAGEKAFKAAMRVRDKVNKEYENLEKAIMRAEKKAGI